jgi:hypothetical protein
MREGTRAVVEGGWQLESLQEQEKLEESGPAVELAERGGSMGEFGEGAKVFDEGVSQLRVDL